MKKNTAITEIADAGPLKKNEVDQNHKTVDKISNPVKRKKKQPYWEARELAVIGIFSALTKTTSLMVALIGGGMNPLTLLLKSLIFTAFLIVLLFKVRKQGVILLFIVTNAVFSMMLMGVGFLLLPPMIIAGLCAEGLVFILGGYGKSFNIFMGVAVYDLMYKIMSIALVWVFVREQPQVLWITTIFVGIGYPGALAGLFVGRKFVKELRHAGIVRN